MFNKDQLVLLMRMQDNMNTSTETDKPWKECNHKWYRYAWLEGAEGIGHLGFKHWKTEVCDIPQADLEVVDVLHFALSDYLNRTAESGDKEELYSDAAEKWLSDFNIVQAMHSGVPKYSYRDAFEYMAGQFIHAKKCDSPTMIMLVENSALSWVELYILYIGKNALNIFRQANGYNNGTYEKIWGCVEDNVHLDLIIKSFKKHPPKGDFYTSVMSALDNLYTNLVKTNTPDATGTK